MKILLISNEYTKPGRIGNPIIYRIQDALSANIKVDSVVFEPFKNNFKSFCDIRKASKKADVIHIQFGGLYALIIWFFLLGINKPKIITFHGTDLHAGELATTKSKLSRIRIRLNRLASIISVCVFSRIGVVSNSLIEYVPRWIYYRRSNRFFLQQLGVDFNLFKEKSIEAAQKELGIVPGKYLLFSDKSNTPIKRKDIAEEIISLLDGKKMKLLVMCGVAPSAVPVYINASEGILLTSDMEGSPNIVREALALNKRVFSVDVGDVKEQINGLKNSCIISRNPIDAAATINVYMENLYTDNTRMTLRENLDMNLLTGKVVDVYVDALKK